MNKIKIYGDGLSIKEIKNKNFSNLDGYTFNPTLFRANKVNDYLDHCQKISKLVINKPISFEVIADDELNMIRQAIILSEISKNIYVKIPIFYTNGKTTLNVIKKLKKQNIKLNVTAIMSLSQIKPLKNFLDSDVILSIFCGRIYDLGINARKEIMKIREYLNKNKVNPKLLWASPRMIFDKYDAENYGCDIITLKSDLLLKLKLKSISQKQYSVDTVNMFFKDAKKSKFNF